MYSAVKATANLNIKIFEKKKEIEVEKNEDEKYQLYIK